MHPLSQPSKLWKLCLVLACFPPPSTADSPLLKNLEEYTLWSSQVRSCSTYNHSEFQCHGIMFRGKCLLVPSRCVRVDRGAKVFVHRSDVLGSASCDYIAHARNTETRFALEINVHPKHTEPMFDLAMLCLDKAFRNIYAPKYSEVKGFNLIEEWLEHSIALCEVNYGVDKSETQTGDCLIASKLTTGEALRLFTIGIVLPMMLLSVLYLLIMYPDFKSNKMEVNYENVTDDVKSDLDVWNLL